MATERELGWDDEIVKDSVDFVLLPDGDYSFKVTGFERGRYAGGQKLPPCNMATVHIEIDSPEGTTTIKHNLYLHTTTEGLLSGFFAAIGQKKKGEPLRMNWNSVIGSTGRCQVYVDNWTTKEGKDAQSNRIKKFYPADEKPAYTPGAF